MDYTNFSEYLNRVTKRLTKKKPWMLPVYSNAVRTLVKFMEENSIRVSDDGMLTLSAGAISLLYDRVLKTRSYHNILKGNCLNDLLHSLKLEGRYNGSWLNVQQQLTRDLILDLDKSVLRDLNIVLTAEEKLSVPVTKGQTGYLKEKEGDYFCSFLASAMLSGALSANFLDRILHIRFSDITFTPLTAKCLHYGSEGAYKGKDGLAYFRYWLSPLAGLYFLRLILFQRKHRRKLRCRFDGDYVFPRLYREANKQKTINETFKRWLRKFLDNGFADANVGINRFRVLCLHKNFDKMPCFILHALINESPHYSYDDVSLAHIEKSLESPEVINIPVSKNIRKQKSKIAMDSEETLLSENKRIMQKNKTFSAILENIHRVRLNLPRKAKKTERIEAAEAIRQIISAINDETVDRDKGFLLNLKFYGLWIALQLDNHKVKVKTVNTRASSIETNFLYMLSATPIDKMSTDELKGIIMKTYSFYGSKNISKGIKAFTADLYDYQDDLFPSMKWDFKKLWADRSLNKESLITTKPFITFQHVRDALKEAAKMSPKLRREKIRLAIILGFFAGMRISEILHLDKYSLIYDGGHVLCVKTSKTKSGIRNIPLTLLMPGEYLKEVVAYFKNADDIQLHEHNGMAEALDYAIAEQDPFKESIDFSREVAKIFKRINLDVRFHHLRHSFANWFLIRWYVAMFGRKCIPDGADFLKEEVFSERYLQYLRFILFGFGEQKRGQNLFSHVMPVLARLIGHAGPDTTMVNYIHVADWIYNLLAHKNQKSPEMTLRSAEIKDFLQLSYPSLPDSLKKRATKTLSMDVLVAEQLRQLKKILKQS